jgi:hypothetical protein
VREVVTEFIEVFLAQHLLVPPIWAPRHAGEFYSLLLLFAIELMIWRLQRPALKRLRSTWAINRRVWCTFLAVRSSLSGSVDGHHTAEVAAGKARNRHSEVSQNPC